MFLVRFFLLKTRFQQFFPHFYSVVGQKIDSTLVQASEARIMSDSSITEHKNYVVLDLFFESESSSDLMKSNNSQTLYNAH